MKIHRREWARGPEYPKSKLTGWGKNRRTVMRDVSQIDTIVVHQAGTLLPPEKWRLRHLRRKYREESDQFVEREAKIGRLLRVSGHAVVAREGFVVCGRPVEAYIWHANKANARSVGIEVEGDFPLEMDEPLMPERQAEALRAAIEWLSGELLRKGSPKCLRLVAHRQANASRVRDPGPEVFGVAADAARELEIRVCPDWTVGSGRPLPRGWY